MAYDPAIGKLVLFGGRAEIPFLDDTWTYHGGSWAQQHPAISPPARLGAAMAYDPAIGKLVLYGGEGSNGGVSTDTWTYDGVTWTQVGLAVPLGQHPTSEPVLFGTLSMAYDPDIGRLFLFGSPTTLGPSTPRIEAWTYKGTTWTRESPAGLPTALSGGPVVYDAALKEFVLSTIFLGVGRETWTYDGTAWAKQPTAAMSNLYCCMAMAYDNSVGQTVLFGGRSGPISEQQYAGLLFNDTWSYNGTSWTKQSPSAAPPPRSNTAMAFDSTLNGLVLFGGDSGSGELADTWTYAPAHQG
jgi:hypothetical protein